MSREEKEPVISTHLPPINCVRFVR